MYDSPQHMTTAVVAEILAEFAWPATFTIEEWLPDGIEVKFPGCTLFFVEGFESAVELEVSSAASGIEVPVPFKDVLDALRQRGSPAADDVKLIDDIVSRASLQKVKNGLRDLCALVLASLSDALRGGRAWADAYKAVYGAPTSGH